MGLFGDGVARPKLLDRVKLTTFKLFQLMTDKMADQTATKMRSQRLVGYLLLSIDFLQLLALLTSTSMGWPPSAMSWLAFLSFFSDIIPVTSQTIFVLSFCVAMTLVVISAGVTVYVWVSAWQGQYNMIWPLKVLRVLVTTIVTVGFIPLMKVLLRPLSCAQLAADLGWAGPQSACMQGRLAAVFSLAVIGLSFLVPFSLFMQLVYYEDSPLSGAPQCKPSGRVDAVHTLVRAAVTALTVFVTDNAGAKSLCIVFIFCCLLAGTAWRLPYYRLSMNRIRCAQYASFSWLAAGSAASALSGNSSAPAGSTWFFVAVSWVCFTPIPAYLASWLPWWRYALLHRLATQIPLPEPGEGEGLASPRVPMSTMGLCDLNRAPSRSLLEFQPDLPSRAETGKSSAHGSVASAMDSTDGLLDDSSDAGTAPAACPDAAPPEHADPPRSPALPSGHEPEEHTSAVGTGPGPLRRMPTQHVREPASIPALGGLHYKVQQQSPEAKNVEWLLQTVRKYWITESDVEVMARSLLKPSHLSVDSLHQVDALFSAALHPKTFGVSSPFLRVAYSTFIVHHKVDQLPALQQLREASRAEASLDLGFQVYKKLQAWYQNRHQEEVGTAVDSLALIQFKKYLGDAQAHHREAVSTLAALWRSLYERRTSSKSSVDHNKIVQHLNRFTHERKRAEKSYELALDKFPLSKKLLRSYALFQLHVENDVSSSKALLSRVDEIESVDANELKSMGGSKFTPTVSDGQSRSSGSSTRSRGSVGGTRRSRSRVRRDEVDMVSNHMMWFRIAIAVLVGCCVGIYISSMSVTDAFAVSLESMDGAGLRRKLTSSAFYFARGLQLAALNGSAATVDALRGGLLKEMKTLHTKHSDLFYHGQPVEEVYALYREPRVQVKHTLAEAHNQSVVYNLGLWDAGNMLVSAGIRVAQYSMEDLKQAERRSEWRFLMDNSRAAIIPSFDEAVGYYQDYDQRVTYNGGVVQATLLACMVLVTGLLVWGVFRPILTMVYSSKKSVLDIVDAIPTHALRLLRHRSKRMATLYQRMERQADEEQGVTEGKLFAVTTHNIEPAASKTHTETVEEVTDSEEGESDEDAGSVGPALVGRAQTRAEVLKGLRTPSSRKIAPAPVHAKGALEPESAVAALTTPALQEEGLAPAAQPGVGDTRLVVSDRSVKAEPVKHVAASPKTIQKQTSSSYRPPRVDGDVVHVIDGEPGGHKPDGQQSHARYSYAMSLRKLTRSSPLFCAKGRWFPKDTRVRRLAMIMALAVVLLLSLYASSFSVTLVIFSRGSFSSAELNNAGRRRYLAREVVNAARELMLGEGGAAERGRLATDLSSLVSYYRRVHNGLRHGDAGLNLPGSERRYPPREALMYGKDAAFQQTGDAYEALTSQGVHDMLVAYWSMAEDILARYGNSTDAQVGLSLPRVMADPVMAAMLRMESSTLGAGLGAAVRMYREEGYAILDELQLYEDIILSVNIIVIGMLYAVLFRQAVAEVQSEVRRREEMLLLMPVTVVSKTRHLQRFFIQQHQT